MGGYYFHFNLQLDKTTDFDSGDLVDYDTNDSVEGWEYYNGSEWLPYPEGGLNDSGDLEQVRLAIPSALPVGIWYRRVKVYK